MKTPDISAVQHLTTKHIERYTVMLDAANRGEPNYRKDELVELLLIWREVRTRGYNYEALSKPAQEEVECALWDSGYDEEG